MIRRKKTYLDQSWKFFLSTSAHEVFSQVDNSLEVGCEENRVMESQRSEVKKSSLRKTSGEDLSEHVGYVNTRRGCFMKIDFNDSLLCNSEEIIPPTQDNQISSVSELLDLSLKGREAGSREMTGGCRGTPETPAGPENVERAGDVCTSGVLCTGDSNRSDNSVSTCINFSLPTYDNQLGLWDFDSEQHFVNLSPVKGHNGKSGPIPASLEQENSESGTVLSFRSNTHADLELEDRWELVRGNFPQRKRFSLSTNKKVEGNSVELVVDESKTPNSDLADRSCTYQKDNGSILNAFSRDNLESVGSLSEDTPPQTHHPYSSQTFSNLNKTCSPNNSSQEQNLLNISEQNYSLSDNTHISQKTFGSQTNKSTYNNPSDSNHKLQSQNPVSEKHFSLTRPYISSTTCETDLTEEMFVPNSDYNRPDKTHFQNSLTQIKESFQNSLDNFNSDSAIEVNYTTCNSTSDTNQSRNMCFQQSLNSLSNENYCFQNPSESATGKVVRESPSDSGILPGNDGCDEVLEIRHHQSPISDRSSSFSPVYSIKGLSTDYNTSSNDVHQYTSSVEANLNKKSNEMNLFECSNHPSDHSPNEIKTEKVMVKKESKKQGVNNISNKNKDFKEFIKKKKKRRNENGGQNFYSEDIFLSNSQSSTSSQTNLNLSYKKKRNRSDCIHVECPSESGKPTDNDGCDIELTEISQGSSSFSPVYRRKVNDLSTDYNASSNDVDEPTLSEAANFNKKSSEMNVSDSSNHAFDHSPNKINETEKMTKRKKKKSKSHEANNIPQNQEDFKDSVKKKKKRENKKDFESFYTENRLPSDSRSSTSSLINNVNLSYQRKRNRSGSVPSEGPSQSGKSTRNDGCDEETEMQHQSSISKKSSSFSFSDNYLSTDYNTSSDKNGHQHSLSVEANFNKESSEMNISDCSNHMSDHGPNKIDELEKITKRKKRKSKRHEVKNISENEKDLVKKKRKKEKEAQSFYIKARLSNDSRSSTSSPTNNLNLSYQRKRNGSDSLDHIKEDSKVEKNIKKIGSKKTKIAEFTNSDELIDSSLYLNGKTIQTKSGVEKKKALHRIFSHKNLNTRENSNGSSPTENVNIEQSSRKMKDNICGGISKGPKSKLVLTFLDLIKVKKKFIEKNKLHRLMDLINDALASWDIASEISDRLNDINVEINWKLSPLHKNAVSIYKKDKFSEDVKKTEGVFEDKECDAIRSRWSQFCELYSFDESHPLGFLPNPLSKRGRETRRNLHNFVRFIGQDLPHRSLHSIYYKFEHMYRNYTTGRFSKEENEILRLLCEAANKVGVKHFLFSTASQLLNRSRYVIHRHCRSSGLVQCTPTKKTIVPGGHIELPKEWQKILKICKKKLIHCSVGKLKESELEELDWAKVGDKCGVSGLEAKHTWLVKVLPQLVARHPLNKFQMITVLIERLNENHFVSWDDVDWMQLSGQVGNVGPVFLYHIFRKTVRKYVPTERQRNITDCIQYLYESVRPMLKRKLDLNMYLRNLN